jgi:DNA-directed RNA polymerase subunit RPC12/RpoP
VDGVRQEQSFEIECPHCHKTFAGEPIKGGSAARYRGFKCPHCRLFVPLHRATDTDLLEPLARDPDGQR